MNILSGSYELLPLLSFIFNIFLISLVLRSNWRNQGNRVFALLLMAMGLWGATIFGMRTSPHPSGWEIALIWEKSAIAMVLVVPVLFYHFTLLHRRIKAPTALMPAFYLAWGVFSVLAISGNVVSGVNEVELFGGYLGWSARYTPLGIIFLAAGYIPVLLGLYNLRWVYLNPGSSQGKNRTLYMMVGGTLFLVGATSDFLFTYGFLFYPFGMIANLGFVAMTTIAILKYHLLELRVVLRSGIAYATLGIFIVGIYGVVFVLFNLAFQPQSGSAQLTSVIAAASVVAIALQPVLNQVQNWADRWFNRERYDHLQALEQFSQETKDITDLTSISESLTRLVSRAMVASSASLLLPAPQRPNFYVASTSGLMAADSVSFKRGSPILTWLGEHEGILRRHDLDGIPSLKDLNPSDQQVIETLDSELFIPLKSKGKLTGVLVVGPKISQEGYSTNDINLLRTVVNQTATTIENARLYGMEAQRSAELEELEKLKQTLLLTVAHELKTPLTAIKAGTEMLELQDKDAPISSTRQRLFRSINRGVERLERLVDESLDYARMQDSNLELELQPTDIRDLYEETIALVMPATRAKRQTLELVLPEDVPTLFVDRRRYERILLNLVSNANKYTDVGGSISVALKLEPTCLITSVTDTGEGIAQDELDKVFNVYYRTSAADGRGAGKSSGLGLAIAKYLVELHGGKIWVDSVLNEGSTFYFSVPLGDDDETFGYR